MMESKEFAIILAAIITASATILVGMIHNEPPPSTPINNSISLQNVANLPPLMVELSPDLSSPQAHGKSITWFAAARDTNNDPLDYKFQLKGPSTRNVWKDQQNWSQRNSWIWDTSDSGIGDYAVRVLVRDNRHVLSDIGDDDKESNTYIITKSSFDLYNEANALLYQGKYNDSIQKFDNAIELDPNNVSIWYGKGRALSNQDKYDEAIKAYDEVIRIDPNYVKAWENKGVALEGKGKYDEARKAFEEAIKAYDVAIRINPNNAEAWYNKAKFLNRRDRFDEAIKACDETIRIDPNNAEYWYIKGIVLYNQGKYDEAIKAYDVAIRINPHYASSLVRKYTAL